MKFRVTKENSAKLQKILFKMGYVWHMIGSEPSYLTKPFVFAESDGTLCCSMLESAFLESYNKAMNTGEFIRENTTLEEDVAVEIRNEKRYKKLLKALDKAGYKWKSSGLPASNEARDFEWFVEDVTIIDFTRACIAIETDKTIAIQWNNKYTKVKLKDALAMIKAEE